MIMYEFAKSGFDISYAGGLFLWRVLQNQNLVESQRNCDQLNLDHLTGQAWMIAVLMTLRNMSTTAYAHRLGRHVTLAWRSRLKQGA